MIRHRARRPHYLRVLPDAQPRSVQARGPAPMPPDPPEGPDVALERLWLPPRKPVRPAAAVRKSLRSALAGAAVMLEHVDAAGSRFPQRADKAANALAVYAGKLTALTDELKRAVYCDRQRDLWRKGKPYDAR